MNEFAWLTMVGGLSTLFVTTLVFGFFPAFVVNVLVRIYPEGHPRRDELVAELRDVPRREQLVWVAEQLVTVLSDGVPARIKAIIERRNAPLRNGKPRVRTVIPGKFPMAFSMAYLTVDEGIGSSDAVDLDRGDKHVVTQFKEHRPVGELPDSSRPES